MVSDVRMMSYLSASCCNRPCNASENQRELKMMLMMMVVMMNMA